MPLIKEKRKQRGRKLNGNGRATQCITIDGNKKAVSVIAQKYLEDFPEVANWDVNVKYSQNKNNRWKIAQSLKDTFTEEQSELEDEDMNIVALVVPDPNLVTEYSLDKENTARYFMTNEQDKEIFIGKAKSRIPEHEFNQDKDVRFKIQEESLNGSRTRKKVHPKDQFYMCMSKNGGRKKSIFYSEDSSEEDYYSEENVEQNETTLEEPSSLPKTYSLKDFLTQSSSVNKKEIKAVKQKELKSFKGKIIFDPDMIQDIKLDEQITKEEFETLEELDTSSEKIILFLDDIDPLASRDWETINDPHLERVTMINKESGILLSLKIQNFGSILECELKVSSLKNEVTDVLPLLSECKTIFDLSNMAQQLLGSGGVIRKSKDPEFSYCLSPHKAGINLLEIEVAKYEEETAADVISMDDHCNVCFDSSVQLDFCACGEGFCHNCWSMYLSSKQLDRFIRCPGFDCNAPVPVSILNWYLTNEKLRAYFNGIVETSVKTDYNVHRCNMSLCKRIVFTDFDSSSNDEQSDNGIKCLCGNKWCRWCGQGYHYPSSCQDKQDFKVYESRLSEWNRLENTVEVRPCPKCGIMWEKMWGCNYMMCSTCGTGFCWGCGQVHGSDHGVCGKINVPLERVEIVPFPSEEFSKTRLESFQLYSQLKDKVVGFYKRDYDAIMGRFLSADKEWFHSNFKNDRQSVLATERGAFIDDIVRRALTVSKQGCISLLNTLLKKSNKRQDQKRIKEIFFLLKSMYADLVEYRPTRSNWETFLKSVDRRTQYFQRKLNLN